MRTIRTLLFFLVALAATLVPGESRAAKHAFLLAIGNYANGVPQLSAPPVDAAALGKALTEMKYVVDLVTDPDRAEFNRRWNAFLGKLKAGDAVTFYFAGHGIQIDSVNYLLPRDTPATNATEAMILDKAINFHEVMEQLQARSPSAALFILDACRNNPFGGKAALAGGQTRALPKGVSAGTSKAAATPSRSSSQGKGLARIDPVLGTFVMYSAAPNEEALDSIPGAPAGSNSPYMTRLLPHLKSADLSLVDVAKRVQEEVIADAKKVNHVQQPFYADGIPGQYNLVSGSGMMRFGTAASKPIAEGQAFDLSAAVDDGIRTGNIVRIGGFASWDGQCQTRHAPEVTVNAAPKHGSIVTGFGSFAVGGIHFGNACPRSEHRGRVAYYIINPDAKDKNLIDTFGVAVKHWNVAPPMTVNETFEIDLATRYFKRTTPKTQPAAAAASKTSAKGSAR